MSGVFEDREKSYEAKWAHDEDLRFRTVARRNKLLGFWAATQMGLAGPAAESYAHELLSGAVDAMLTSHQLQCDPSTGEAWAPLRPETILASYDSVFAADVWPEDLGKR